MRVWHASTDDAVAKAFEGDLEPHGGRGVTQGEGGPCTEPTKSGLVSQWEEYPLESVEDLQRWAADVMGVSREVHGDGMREEIRAGGPGLPQDFGQHRRTPCGIFEAGGDPLEPPPTTGIDVEPGFRESVYAPIQSGPSPTFEGSITVADRSGGRGPILEPFRNKLGLPDEFKQQYLW